VPLARDAALLRLPPRFAVVIPCFAPLPRQRGWRHAEVLLPGAVPAPGSRTVAGALRIAGLGRDHRFAEHHRGPGRAAWSGRAARALFGLLLGAIGRQADRRQRRPPRSRPLLEGALRQGKRAALAGADAAGAGALGGAGLGAAVPDRARPSGAVPPRAGGAPNAADRARQLALQARRWLPPERALVVVAASASAALGPLAALQRRGGVACVARLRLDAALWRPAPPRRPGTIGRPRLKGARLPALAAVLADPAAPWRRVAAPGW